MRPAPAARRCGARACRATMGAAPPACRARAAERDWRVPHPDQGEGAVLHRDLAAGATRRPGRHETLSEQEVREAMGEPTIVTVRGPIPADQLGVTLTHEHIFINLVQEYRGDGLLNDAPLAARELTRFREAGGATVVDVTNASLGRHPRTLRAISEQVGVNVVLGAGLYRHQYFDAAWVDRTSTDAIAEWIVRDLTVGIADTGIRAGIIGEIACDEWITAQEE